MSLLKIKMFSFHLYRYLVIVFLRVIIIFFDTFEQALTFLI